MSIEIEKSLLENACKEMIETILFCLPNAFRGTIYRIGKSPELIAERIASGEKKEGNELGIQWLLPEASEFNPPGKSWLDYRDDPSRPLEAMAWCVERQKSWTSEEPKKDQRSVRLQVEGKIEDFHHMEPVLLPKSDLNVDMYSFVEYPRDHEGNLIWQDSEYVVVAVIKIHFKPHTISIGSHETKVIKRLSRSLGTELLSYQLKQDSMIAVEKLAKDRLNACDILADSLRNAITKSGLVFSIVKQEIGYLREQWEKLLMKEINVDDEKLCAINELNNILNEFSEHDNEVAIELETAHEKFLGLSLPPEKGEKWVDMQIEARWQDLSAKSKGPEMSGRVSESINRLKKSLYFGQDPKIISDYHALPEELKEEFVDILYNNSDRYSSSMLDRLIEILSSPELNIPSREKTQKNLTRLKALAETMSQLERNTNFLLRQVLNGNRDDVKIKKT